MADTKCICRVPGIVTVGCRVHHLMPDGAPVAEHEVRCACGNFTDARQCVPFDREDDSEPALMCLRYIDDFTGEFTDSGCVEWARGQAHLTEVTPAQAGGGS